MVRKDSLKQHVAWRLLLTTHAKLTKKIAKLMSESEGISYDTFDILITLSEAPSSSMSMSELAGAAFFSNSSVSRRVAALEKEGLVRRDRCSEDGRVYYAVLTEAGKEALRKAWPVYRSLIDELFADVVSATSAMHMVRTLRQVLSRLDDQTVVDGLQNDRTEEPRF